MHILGISALYHDSAAALVRDGEIIAAAQEERFTRKKHDYGFPQQAIAYCLHEAGIEPAQLDYVGFYDKPLSKFDRLLETYLAHAPRGFRSFCKAMPLWLRTKLHLPRIMHRELKRQYKKRFVFAEHHESHAASAFFPSPFDEAAILTIDGVGEWTTAAVGVGRGNRIELLRELRFPHSLGLLYSAFTYYCGFKVNSGEYKLMGLAPYGDPIYRDKICEHLLDLKEDGSFRMDMSYFGYCDGLTMTSPKFDRLLGAPPRRPEAELTQFYMDVAASIQAVTEDIVLRAGRYAREQTGMRNLVMAGGVALNCVANGRLAREGPFDNVWIQPAAGDAGGALGVALFIWHQLLENPRRPAAQDSQKGSLLGPAYTTLEVQSFLDSAGANYEVIDDEAALIERVTELMAAEKTIGWFEGRMEFGPRALGSRSIIGDARSETMQSVMNLKIKFRESFRPFAPCVLREEVQDYFEMRQHQDSPYMLLVADVRADKRLGLNGQTTGLKGVERLLKVKRSVVPAITHVDYSARVQTVDELRRGRFYRLMKRFHERTGCPVIVNTSFNVRGEPIVCSPEHAYRCFMNTNMDALVLENCILLKEKEQPNLDSRRVGTNGDEIDPGLAKAWCCPACEGGLEVKGNRATCAKCRRAFEDDDGIWQLYRPHEQFEGDVTETVKQFYEEHPFPDYDDDESVGSLIAKARRGLYARLLAEQIPHNSRVLDIGCGTGQLSNFLGVGCRTVVGTDLCMNSLRLAEGFRRKQGLSRVRFLQMNLFKPALRNEQFDVVLCNGVLHHTSDPYGGFKSISRLVKPGGYIVIGLYNTYGRLLQDVRRLVFRLIGARVERIDPYLRTTRMSKGKREAWFADQYQHPHESRHTMGEVLRWYDHNGFEFVNAIPKFRVWDPFSTDEGLFEAAERGTRVDRALAQAQMIITSSNEGGFYIVIGRKRGER